MSHELRTPLNAIIGFSEIMESGMFGALGSDKYVEYCRDIHRSGEYLLDVINDVLDMSKIEAGRLKLDLENVELDRELSDALRVVTTRAQEKKLKLTSRIASGIRLRADRRALKQIALNLLSNAVKFTPEKGRITVRGRVSRGAVVIGIQDSGIGIAARRAAEARPAVRAGRKPAHQDPPRLGAGPGHRQVADRAAWRRHAHPLDARRRHDGGGAPAARWAAG